MKSPIYEMSMIAMIWLSMKFPNAVFTNAVFTNMSKNNNSLATSIKFKFFMWLFLGVSWCSFFKSSNSFVFLNMYVI